jgi:hypothetical protein
MVDNHMFSEFMHSINNISWLEIGRLPTIDVEDLDGIL